MQNPLLETTGLPAFSHIQAQHLEPAIDHLLQENKTTIQKLLNENTEYSWDNLVQPLEDMDDRLSRAWSPASHMNSVVNSDVLRAAYNACLPKLSAYSTELGQNEGLYRAFKQIAESSTFDQLETAQQKIIHNALRDFRLSGIELETDARNRFKAIMQELSSLSAKFDENLLDATHAWKKHITNIDELKGLPESAIALAQQIAERENKDGWLLTLEFPSYFPVITYADSRALREEVYTAYVTRASDQGPHPRKWDNTQIMEQLLTLRKEMALLLGFDNYADYSIATKMAASTEQVLSFLNDLADRSTSIAKKELEEIREFAQEQHQHDTLEAWDISYFSEKMRKQRYDISQEELKPYFPENHVIDGMFKVVNRLYGLHIKEEQGIDCWHEDVRFFSIHDEEENLRGQFYLDLYARPHKRGGAWMDECITRKSIADKIQTPVAYLTCNFSPPIGDDPALFTHEEVLTLFHEFGHGLHHMLTQINFSGVSGISGVAWDAVELPSQFMENWCWERDALNMISAHYKTGEAIPDDLYQRMQAARNFQSAMQMVRQLEFSIFDFQLHIEFKAEQKGHIYEVLKQVRDRVSVIQPPSFNRFPHSFSHIFSGGYAAGYYSYKWAEVLSSDAFSAFEESDIFDRETGMRFLSCILEQGGSREPMELFIEFRGREPNIDALLRHSGLMLEAS
ncbi:MAG: oligopeptidase A [Gammaproteobacteria bacterium]|nr:oligopeptidase A [Gammaproteobacteria bacterium]